MNTKKIVASLLFIGFASFCMVAVAQPQTIRMEVLNNISPIDSIHFANIVELSADSILVAAEEVTDSIQCKVPLRVSEADNSKLYETIENWYGTPYRRSGMTLSGTDCSGFVQSIYKEVYCVDLLRSSREMAQHIIPIEKNDLREGDLIFFRVRNSKTVNHVGIYLKDGYFVHASYSRGVIVDKLDQTYWKRYYYKAGRCFSEP